MDTLILYDINKNAFYINVKRVFYYNLKKYGIKEERLLKSAIIIDNEEKAGNVINLIKTIKNKYGDDSISAYVIKGSFIIEKI
ncbi:MAG: hypothetical protein QXS91_01875 [Candidatus Anstonellales archaeon]